MKNNTTFALPFALLFCLFAALPAHAVKGRPSPFAHHAGGTLVGQLGSGRSSATQSISASLGKLANSKSPSSW